jgi:N-acetylmuramoyl-L-alanine amidase
MNILLIAGHGDGDSGAIGNGYKEAEVTRELASMVESILKNYADITVFDKTKNMYKYLKNDGMFNFAPYSYIFEIHFNAGGGQGTEILVHENQKGVSVEETILKNISALGFKNRGIKRRNNLYNMNAMHKKNKEYALLETCFIDSASDMTVWKNNAYDIALAVANGIISGFGLKLKNKEITTPSEIVAEISKEIEISDPQKAVDDLTRSMNENSSCYWMLKKIANKK